MSGLDPLKIGVFGAQGRMGREVAHLAAEREDMVVAALVGRPGAEAQAQGLVSADKALSLCDVAIDFSTSQASAALARAAAGRGAPALILGATGFSHADEATVREAAKRIAIVKSANFSLGVNLLLDLVERAAEALSAVDYDIEIFEAHHRRKRDAPSGTALMMGEAAARGRSADLAQVSVRSRDGFTGPRPEGAIGFSVMRGGGIVGEHSVTFAAEDEIVTLSHSARDRSLFARGALRAAAWVVGQPAGLYDMKDVLGLRGR